MQQLIVTARKAAVVPLELFVTIAVAALVLDVLWGILTRFVLQSPSRWTEEVAIILLVWVSLLGAAVAFSRQEHLGVDYFVGKLAPNAQKLLAVVVQLLTIFFAGWVMLYGGYVLVTETLGSGQLTPALEIKMGYVYLAVPVSGVFIVLFSIERTLELLFGWPSPDDAADARVDATGEAT